MNDLPDPAQPTSSPQGVSKPMQIPEAPSSGALSSGSISSKEIEVGGVSSGETFPLKDVGTKEFELPKEVTSAGVKIQPTTVQIPPKVSDLGVKPAGSSVPVGTGQSITLPLTDAQIAEGLKQSITSSWRWLAVWCERKVKQVFRIQNEKQIKH